MDKLPIDQQKTALRQQAKRLRAGLAAERRADFSAVVCRHLLGSGLCKPGMIVAGYWPIGDELDCRPILEALRDGGSAVALPMVTGPAEPLDWRIWDAAAPLVAAGFGARAPDGTARRAVPHLILLPLLSFDQFGTRLGYGGGYYDRSIADIHPRPLLVGLAFGAQELPHVPRDVHDQALDAVVTEAGLRYSGSP